jgi:CubicO group peptidase (beta-lactamase class C family)
VQKIPLDVLRKYELSPPIPFTALRERLMSITIDEEAKEVTSNIMGSISKAKYHSATLGCSPVIPLNGSESLPQSSFQLQDHLHTTRQGRERDGGVTTNVQGAIQQIVSEQFRPSSEWSEEKIKQHAQAIAKAKTRAIVVMQGGAVVAEGYADSHHVGKDTPLMGWSMTKSLLSALVGARIQESGNVSLADVVTFPECDSRDCGEKFTVENLLRMDTGLNDLEEYISGFSVGDVVRMIFTQHSTATFALKNKKVVRKPGTTFQYSSATSNLLSHVLRSSFPNDSSYWSFPQKVLSKIDAHSFVIETDPSGTFVGSSFSYATARDWAKLGELHLRDGVSRSGERILPVGWVRRISTPGVSPVYGGHWWTGPMEDKPYSKALPPDHYRADGFDFQTTIVIPSLDAVIVRMGVTHNYKDWDACSFFTDIVALLKERIGR